VGRHVNKGLVFTACTRDNGRPGPWAPRFVDLDSDWRAALVADGADLNTAPRVINGVAVPRTIKRPVSTLSQDESAAERGLLDALPDAELHDLDLDRVSDDDATPEELARACKAILALLPELVALAPAWSARPGRGVHVRLPRLATPTVGANAALGRLVEQRAAAAGWIARVSERGTPDSRFRRVPGTGWELDVTKAESGGRGGLMRLPGGRHKDGVTRKQIVPVPAGAVDGALLVKLAPEVVVRGRRVRSSPTVALTSPRLAGAQTGLRALVPQGDRHRARMALADALLSAGVQERDGVPFVDAALGDSVDASSAWHSTRMRRGQGQSRVGAGWLLDSLPPDVIVELGVIFAQHTALPQGESLERLFGAPLRTTARLGKIEGDLAKSTRAAARCRLYRGEGRCGVIACGALKNTYKTRCDQRVCVPCALVKARQAAEVAPEWTGKAWVAWSYTDTLDEAKRITSGADARTFEPCERGWKWTVYVRENDAPERVSLYRGRSPVTDPVEEQRDVPGDVARALALSAPVRVATWLDAAIRTRPALALARWEESRSRALHRTCTAGQGYELPTEAMTREAAKEAAEQRGECDEKCLEACEHDGFDVGKRYDYVLLDRQGRAVETLVTCVTLPMKHDELCQLHDEGYAGYGLPPPPEVEHTKTRRMVGAPPT
jgi:hypothetical protein